MITLGLETSGQAGSVALLCDGTLLGERDLSREGRRHARTLIAEIRDLLKDAAIAPADVNTIAVSIGPGSFTGLRVGVTCAKTWAYATGAAITGVETFLAVASQSQTVTQRLQVIDDAQRGELFVGTFERDDDGSWFQCGTTEIISTDEWIAGLTPKTVVSGPAVLKLHDRLIGRCVFEVTEVLVPTARSIARIGERRALHGETSDAWGLEPLYLRRSAAEEKAQRGC